MKRFFLLVIVLQSFTFLSCNSQQQSKQELIVGEWEVMATSNYPQPNNNKEVMIFFKNKNFSHGYRANGVLKEDAKGTFNFKENETQLELLPPEGTRDVTEIIELTNETLVLKAKVGEDSKITLKKIK